MTNATSAEATSCQPQTAGAPTATVIAAEAPWYTHFPAAKSAPEWLPQQELLSWLQAGDGGAALVPGRDFLLVDLRRNDHAGGTIKGSLNLPAQSLWWSLPVVYELGMKMQARKVVFYCGSSTGRGARAASWLADYINSQAPPGTGEAVLSYALQGGVRGWANAGPEYVGLMEGYDEGYWAAGGRGA